MERAAAIILSSLCTAICVEYFILPGFWTAAVEADIPSCEVWECSDCILGILQKTIMILL